MGEDTNSRGLFFRKRPKEDEQQSAPQTPHMDPTTTYDTSMVFKPNAPKHAATNSGFDPTTAPSMTGDFMADEKAERAFAMELAQSMSLPFVDLN